MAQFSVEVCYALPDAADLCEVPADFDTTVRDAIGRSGVLQRHPDIDLSNHGVGRFGRPIGLEELVQQGDRIEIYRPMPADPKELRRRAAKRP